MRGAFGDKTESERGSKTGVVSFRSSNALRYHCLCRDAAPRRSAAAHLTGLPVHGIHPAETKDRMLPVLAQATH